MEDTLHRASHLNGVHATRSTERDGEHDVKVSTIITASAILAGASAIALPSGSFRAVDGTPPDRPVKRPLSARAVVPAAPPRGERASRPATASAATEFARLARATGVDKVIENSCVECHNASKLRGNLSLDDFDAAKATAHPEVAERIINKLRAGMMPPPGKARPGGDTLTLLATLLERQLDEQSARNPEPGWRTFQRLNRAEYSTAIRDLLTVEIDAGKWLPLDTKSANFDNIADVQLPSATVLDAYLDAAAEISRLAVGDPKASVTSTSYKIPRLASQMEQVPGAPAGTRGGVVATHNFPADGEYVFEVTLHSIPTGQLFGSTAPFDERIEIAVDGERVAMLSVDRWMSQADADGMDLKTPRIAVRAGPHRVSAAYVRTFDGPVNDNIAPHGHSIADTQIGSQLGITVVSHMREMAVRGPFNPTGVSDTPSRRRIFSCRPTSTADSRGCAQRIVASLAAAAYRRPVTATDVAPLMTFYDEGTKQGGFESGVRSALEAVLASPHFLFRAEPLPAGAKAGQRYALAGADLASRLSFFLWGTAPDSALLASARRGTLGDTAVLRAQVRRMLTDSRSEALASRFAAQWLRLQDIDKVHPDALQYPDFHTQLAESMREETERFFYSIVRENRSILDLFDADYTYVNEALANHYGIPGVTGDAFRRVQYPDNRRRGLLGHASVLTLTSHANRTSPVLRGKWVMEVLMGTPPPPPPPDVPDLDKTGEAKDGRMLTTSERMAMHRANPQCRSCHAYIDPIGLALDNYDVIGRWRIKENDSPLGTKGEFYDGTVVSSPEELRAALRRRPAPLLRNFTANLMAYALGRRVEYYDQPAIRRVVARATGKGYRFDEFVVGVVQSEAFRQRRVPPAQVSDRGAAAVPGHGPQ
jgi:hypothetical protein